jgi:hypothetical protein
MKNILALLITLLTIQANCQDKTIIKGRIQNFHFSKISIQSDENPITGTDDEFFAQLSDSGKFIIEAEIHVPHFFHVYIGNNAICFIYVCPNSKTILNIDSLTYNQADDYYPKWSLAIYDDYLTKRISLYFDKGIKKDSLKGVFDHVLGLQKDNKAAMKELKTKYNLNDCQFNYAKGVFAYSDYLMLWTEANKYPFKDDIYKFMNWLPLSDTNSIQSLDYQRSLLVFVLHKIYVENGWDDINSFDHESDEFQVKFHDKVLAVIKNIKVRNIMFTRQACNLLHTGSSAAELIYPKYQKDCSDPYLKQITAKYYQEFKE